MKPKSSDSRPWAPLQLLSKPVPRAGTGHTHDHNEVTAGTGCLWVPTPRTRQPDWDLEEGRHRCANCVSALTAAEVLVRAHSWMQVDTPGRSLTEAVPHFPESIPLPASESL